MAKNEILDAIEILIDRLKALEEKAYRDGKSKDYIRGLIDAMYQVSIVDEVEDRKSKEEYDTK